MNDNIHLFTQHLQGINGRLEELYQQATRGDQLSSDFLLPIAFKELGIVAEELNVATEELLQQQEELIFSRMAIETERQRYQQLFDFSPDAYIVTDHLGIIREANRTAASLFNISATSLVGKALSNYVPLPERSSFRSQINQLFHTDKPQEWVINLCPRHGECFKAALKVASVRSEEGSLINLLICIRDVSDRPQFSGSTPAIRSPDYQARGKHSYTKGEIIPFEHKYIYLVQEGLVKLSTLSEQGEEVIVGFANAQMPFGSCLTTLPTYQATVLSKAVDVITIAWEEAITLPHVAQYIFPKIIHRLQQAESFLSISGYRRVQDRLYNLLLLLKKEFGQPLAQGVCINVRLTHSDIASICGTTRVTITRLINKLEKQGIITFDKNSHIVLLAEGNREQGIVNRAGKSLF